MDALSYVFVCRHTSASVKDVTKVASFFCLKTYLKIEIHSNPPGW